MKNDIENKFRGITIISLVVTIVVLLILAGISLAFLTGNNGVINNAHRASAETSKSQEKEIIDKAVVYSVDKSKYGNVEKQYVISELNQYPEVKDIDELDACIKVTFQDDNTYIINTDGNIYNFVEEVEEGIKVTSDNDNTYIITKDGKVYKDGEDIPKSPEEIKEEEVKASTNVGKKVDFVSKYSDDLIWRLFYADDDYVYLISSKLSSDGTEEVNSQKTAHTTLGYLGLIQWYTPNYSGSSAITDEFLRSLNSKWYETLGDNEATNENAKAVAWLMDQKVWEGWKDENGLAKYVIGGPTLELFAKSYNSNAAINNTTEISYTANTEFGYDFSNGSLKFSYDFNNGIYTSRIEEENKDYDSYWIASPKALVGDSTWEGNSIFTIMKNKGFYFGASYYGLGVRPVAIIKTKDYVKSNLRLLE